MCCVTTNGIPRTGKKLVQAKYALDPGVSVNRASKTFGIARIALAVHFWERWLFFLRCLQDYLLKMLQEFLLGWTRCRCLTKGFLIRLLRPQSPPETPKNFPGVSPRISPEIFSSDSSSYSLGDSSENINMLGILQEFLMGFLQKFLHGNFRKFLLEFLQKFFLEFNQKFLLFFQGFLKNLFQKILLRCFFVDNSCDHFENFDRDSSSHS